MKLFGREPAVWLGLIAALVMGVSTFLWNLSPDQQGTINALAVAAFGVATAASVHQGTMAAVTAGFKALIALGISFGLHLSADQQLVIMTVVAAVGSFWVRTQATPKEPAIPK